ncbi:MAG: phosphatase PAP2 family protein [bacterium]
MEVLQNVDASLFYFINSTIANPVTDKLMPIITERNNWFIFYVLIWLYLFVKGGRRGRTAAVLIILLILFSDQFANNILKPFFQRIRPCHVLPNVHLLINCSDSYAFPSNHAVNNFAAATLFSYFYPAMKYFLFTGAFLVAVSRVMCGVHYPFDIIGGAIFGIISALIIIYLWKAINRKLNFLPD